MSGEKILQFFTTYPWLGPSLGAALGFFLNLPVTICLLKRELKQFEIRRAGERRYQSELFLYQHLIIKEIENYVDYANQTELTFGRLCQTLLTDTQKKRKKIETAQEEVDGYDRGIRTEIISKSVVFSKDFAEKAEASWTTFYDDSTTQITKLDRATLSQEVCLKYHGEISDLKAKYLDEIFKLVKEFHPRQI